MRWLRTALATAAVVAAVVAGAPTEASATAILVVVPDSINAGFSVEVRARCGGNVNPAFVSSRAFGSVTLVPDNGGLRTDVTVPSSTRAGIYTVSLACASGEKASTKLTVVRGSAPPNPNQGPRTGGGEMAASLGGKLALYGGLGGIVVGLGIWLMLGLRRRTSV